MAKTGTLSLLDLFNERFQTVASFGQNNLAEIAQNDLNTYRDMTADMFGDLASRTQDRLRIAGGTDIGDMTEVDEHGRAPTIKVGSGSTLGFPLRLFQRNMAWTRKWMQNHSVGEMAEQILNAQSAHQYTLIRDMKRAIFYPSNETFTDRLAAPVIDIGVKRFANADSFVIPNGPSGQVFTASSHQHYTAGDTLTAADTKAQIHNVMEHGHTRQVVLAIAFEDQALYEALTGFVKYNQPQVIPSDSTARTASVLDQMIGDRVVGTFEGAIVAVKPWVPQGYSFAWDRQDPNKPLALRTRDGGAPALVIAAEHEGYPLQAQFMESEFGFGVSTRTNGAVHQHDAAVDNTYETPTIS